MMVMLRMTVSKKERMLKGLKKMEDFIEEFKGCIEEAETEDGEMSYREHGMHDDYDEEEELKKLVSRYAKLKKRMGK